MPTHSEKGRKNNLYHASKTGLDKHSIVTALKLIVEFIEFAFPLLNFVLEFFENE